MTPGGGHQFSSPESRPVGSGLLMLALRALFAAILVAVGMTLATSREVPDWLAELNKEFLFFSFLGIALVVIALDIFVPRKSLAAISGTFFGLVVGMVVAYGLSLIVDMVAQTIVGSPRADNPGEYYTADQIKIALGVICCYLSVSFILQTKDDVRFVIPYVEFAKQSKGAKPLILDTSVIVDGRIADIAETRIIDSEMIVPRFVLQELQTIADSGDKLKRTRGRRGLDMLNKLQSSEKSDIQILDVVVDGSSVDAGVDELLIDLCVELGGKVVTNDYNLNKIAQLRGVTVININDLTNALKPVFLPGETLSIKIIKPGEEMGQGIGYLEDGTMVVAEGGRNHIGDTIGITVTSVLQTSAGRMIFGRAEGSPPSEANDRKRYHRPSRGASQGGAGEVNL